jgi:hypothetical protein
LTRVPSSTPPSDPIRPLICIAECEIGNLRAEAIGPISKDTMTQPQSIPAVKCAGKRCGQFHFYPLQPKIPNRFWWCPDRCGTVTTITAAPLTHESPELWSQETTVYSLAVPCPNCREELRLYRAFHKHLDITSTKFKEDATASNLQLRCQCGTTTRVHGHALPRHEFSFPPKLWIWCEGREPLPLAEPVPGRPAPPDMYRYRVVDSSSAAVSSLLTEGTAQCIARPSTERAIELWFERTGRKPADTKYIPAAELAGVAD